MTLELAREDLGSEIGNIEFLSFRDRDSEAVELMNVNTFEEDPKETRDIEVRSSHPWRAVGIAVSMGVIVGWLVCRRERRF